MEDKQYGIITNMLKGMDKDRSKPAPRISHKIGRFLSEYREASSYVASELVKSGAPSNRGKFINGEFLGPVDIIPLFGFSANHIKSTDFANSRTVPVICPQVLSKVNLELWETTNTAARVASFLDNPESNEIGVRLTGKYRWIPPNRITPGNSHVDPLPGKRAEKLTSYPFLNYSGEDIQLPPHPMEYKPLFLGDEPRLAALRIVIGIPCSDNFLEIPYTLRNDVKQIPIKTAECTESSVCLAIAERKKSIFLCVREPHETEWIPVLAGPADDEICANFQISWFRFNRFLGFFETNAKDSDSELEIARQNGVNDITVLPYEEWFDIKPVVRDMARTVRGRAYNKNTTISGQ